MFYSKRKNISVLLILLIVFNSFGYVFVYFQMQFIFKNLAYEKTYSVLNEDQLTQIRIPLGEINNNPEFSQLDESEISYNGRMYDVYKTETSGTDIVFYCCSDENEDALNNAFASFSRQNTDRTSNNPITNFIKLIIKEACFTEYLSNLPEINVNCSIPQTESKISASHFEVLTPPPKHS
jgi:hypothetical protein